MFSSYSLSNNVLQQFLKIDKINIRLLSSLQRVSFEIDNEITEKIIDNKLKPRKHPGIIKIPITGLPHKIKNAVGHILDDTSRVQLLKGCARFASYLQSRLLPVEQKHLMNRIKSVREEVENKLNINKENFSEVEEENYVKSVQIKTANILRKRIYNWQPIQYTRYKGLQYLFARASPEYATLMHIFKEMTIRDNFKPKRVFDFGSGVGTVIWAVTETWGNSLKEYFCVDTSREMNDLSEEIINLYNQELKNKIFYRQFLPSGYPNYDLVVSAYSLLELSSSEMRLETVAKLWSKTGKYLVLIEQGTMAGFKAITEARDFILHASGQDDKNSNKASLFSPCPHEFKCPRILENEQNNKNIPCNFEISYYDLRGNKKKSELYSYVVLKKGPRNVEDAQWPRIIQPVLCRSRHTICRLCTKYGKFQEIVVSPAKNGKIAHRCSRSSNWGDRLPINVKETSNDDQIEIIDDSENI